MINADPPTPRNDDSFNDILKNMKKQTQYLQEIESNTEDISNVQLEIKNELLRTNLGGNRNDSDSRRRSNNNDVDESSSWLSKLAKFSLGAAVTGAIGWLFSTDNPQIKNVREKAQKEVSEFLQSSIKSVYTWIKDSISNTFNSIFGDTKEAEERRKNIIGTLGDIFDGISKFIVEGFTSAFNFIKKKFESGNTLEGAGWSVAALTLISKFIPDIILDLAKNIVGALKNVAILALQGLLTPAGLAAIAVAAAGAVGWTVGTAIYNAATSEPVKPNKEEADRNIKPDFPAVSVRQGGPSPEEQKSDLADRIKKQKQEIDVLQETLQRQLETNQREYNKIPASVDDDTRNKLQLEILNRSGITSVSAAKLEAEKRLKELEDRLKSIAGGSEETKRNPAAAMVGNPNVKLMGVPKGREDIAMLIYNKFRAANFTDIQARAAVANAIAESGLNPDAHNLRGEASYGLFQANMRGGLGVGHRPEDLLNPEYNIDLIIKEAKKSAAFKSATNITDAITAFVNDIERPKNKSGEIKNRLQIASGLSGTEFGDGNQLITPTNTNPVINTTRTAGDTTRTQISSGITAPTSLGMGLIRNNDPAFVKIIEQLTMLAFGKSPFVH